MTHYATLLSHCLADESKARRDAILAKEPAATQRAVRHCMAGLAKRLAAYVANAGANDDQLTKAQRRDMRRERLAAIYEPWLRERVERMVWERFEGKGAS